MMRLHFIILIILIRATVLGQDLISLRHSRTDTRKSDFYISTENKKIKFVDTLEYFWFKSQQIHSTQGFASGNLLEGKYISYYLSGQLAEQGNFICGLKNGEWKSWFESGQLKSIFHFEAGILNGNFFEYNEIGELLVSGNYKNGQLHGEIVTNGETEQYKHGTLFEKNRHDTPTNNENGVTESEEKKNWFSFFEKKKRDSKSSKNKKMPKENTNNNRKPFFDREKKTKSKK